VFALTHARWPQDEELANKCDTSAVDLILGGHDHDYGVRVIDRDVVDGHMRRITLVKSGTDFREFSVLSLTVDDEDVPDNGLESGKKRRKFLSDVRIERVQLTSRIAPDPKIAEQIEKLVAARNAELNVVIGEIDVDVDARFSEVRTHETNAGNFVCDAMLSALEADAALLNGGALRADCVFPKGNFTADQLARLLPYEDPVVVLEVTGKQLYEALENGVSKLPDYDGRFPQVAGVRFQYDTCRSPRERIDPSKVVVAGKTLHLDEVCIGVTSLY
jgi:5'-nucleotidase